MALNRKDVKKPSLPKEAKQVDALGGEVVVRGLLLSDRLALAINNTKPYSNIAETLARTVMDEEGEPIYTADEWEIFGAKHAEAAFELFAIAQRLSGMGEEKKDATPS